MTSLIMQDGQQYIRNKGGRPKKAVTKTCVLSLKCSAEERQMIAEKSAMLGLSVSEFLRKLATDYTIVLQDQGLLREVLQFSATLNHLAANLNQIAKKRNSRQDLSLLELDLLRLQAAQLKGIAREIKTKLS